MNVGGETQEQFTYTINWGDGTPIDSGPPTIDVLGGPGTPTQGSFDGSHIYADNGVYTVTVTVSDDDGGTAVATISVLVHNVDPTLVVPGDRMADEGVAFSITNIGQFTDPGFDNPLNVGGETVERFTYAINWGDGSGLDAGPVTNFTTGHAGVPSAGSFNGGHTYAAAGTYTVTVTVSDDDGGAATGTFTVTVKSGAIIIVTAPGQTVDEGSQLSVNPIAQFVDPRPGGASSYQYTINWGDGQAPSAGLATLGLPNGEGRVTGSLPGSHVYADNGLYTVTVTVSASDGRSSQAMLNVTVHNVAPTITAVTPNLTVPLGTTLLIPNVVHFNDPGFDNPLAPGGGTTERFTYVINWTDGTPNSTGQADILSPGGVSLLTQGALNSQHLFAFPATFNVGVTVMDDDGGAASATFSVQVFVLRQPAASLFFPPGGGGGTSPPPQAPLPAIDTRATPPPQIIREELRRARTAAVAGAELRLVLRIVLPTGVEDASSDETLPDEVLDNLRGLFQRLPDGHYRIYQIEADDVERLVVDVAIHQGRSTTLFDRSQSLRNEAEQPDANPPLLPAEPATPPPAPAPVEKSGAAAEETSRSEAGALISGGLGAALAWPWRRSCLRPQVREAEPGSLKKAHRILRARGKPSDADLSGL